MLAHNGVAERKDYFVSNSELIDSDAFGNVDVVDQQLECNPIMIPFYAYVSTRFIAQCCLHKSMQTVCKNKRETRKINIEILM